MARPALVPMICGAGAAVLLTVGGCGGSVQETADGAAVAQPADEGAPPDEGDADDGDAAQAEDTAEVDDATGSDEGGSGDRPGRPGGEVSAGGGGARPGVPFDQPVFQDIGRDFDEDARQSIEDRCADVCTVAYSVDGDPDDQSQACRISSFSYEPADSGGFFQIGAEVTVHVTCEATETLEGETTDGEATEGEVTEGEVTEGEVTEGEATEEEATEEEATEGQTTEEEATEGEVTEGEVTEGETTEEETTEDSAG